MDIQKYEAFIKTAELQSVRLAAEELGYTQAGLGYILKTLEEELGTALFHRDYGRVYLTAEGKELMPLVHEVCNDQRRLLDRLSELKKLEAGRISLAVFTSVAVHWLPFLMKGFLKKYPGIRFDVRFYEERQILDDMLWAGDVDFGFTVLPDADDSFEKILLKKDPMAVALAADHPLADAPFFPAAAMTEEPYISGGSHSEMSDVFYCNGVKVSPYLTLDNDFAVMSMVSQGFGYSLFPRMLLQNLPFPLTVLDPEAPFSREVGIALRSLDKASDAARAFIAFTKEWVRENG